MTVDQHRRRGFTSDSGVRSMRDIPIERDRGHSTFWL
ncbi:hypothetical protein LI99_18545 [Mycolicibacterium smegmatis]|uniref:Uncharacterized protein n=2 Tax=Mycolicibacterium smegmatis (strain ATCC 700084 / mc(2)155) TaxID=246196 RepID=I7GAC6_MYCS2|nr:hypothetical protein MSMEG_3732 [Mycolicibacterium smegmatis MC2 155]AIU15482.1 hypothetical protein LI99_18545 [Mycolicibacterium smegmatis]AFP40106.1 hypothetical protein MSMEI_3643 [Mycolicibacterium smegmatis MC2 155]AIU08857.1 hypothetical protein LJ00_18540 [Mycolicibacterium smegmatis MC2 155]AIU22105.1 hypothetical protein LI98_18550 [Mycolicibacterium smegmatis]